MFLRPVFNFFFRRVMLAPHRRRAFWKRSYQRFNQRLADRGVIFLDYGYAPASSDPSIDLTAFEEDQRTHIHMYHHVAGAVDLRNKDVLEIGCGRGGGANYVAGHLGARRMIGVDLSAQAMAFAHRTHRSGARFLCGDAQAIPFGDASFDAVVNVESSHCYPSFAAFLREVYRVLRPGGHLLYVDFRRTEEWPGWIEAVAASGLKIIDREDITADVIRAMLLNQDRKKRMVEDIAPRYMHSTLYEFTGCEGSMIQQSFASGQSQYVRYLLQKPV